ncbi:hypothetical protein COOONC_27093 [Cooperia oncophora]
MRDAMGRPGRRQFLHGSLPINDASSTHTHTYAGRGPSDRRVGGGTRLASNEAPGPDRISVDFLKSASRTVIKQLTSTACSLLRIRDVGGEQGVSTLTRAQRALERTLLNINRREQRCRNLHSTDMRSMSGILDAVVYAWNAKKRWAGHVVRRTDDRWDTRMTLCELSERPWKSARLAALQPTNTGSKLLKIANNGGKRVLVAEENRLNNERPSIQPSTIR